MLINVERIIQSVNDNPHAKRYFAQITEEIKGYNLPLRLQNVKEHKDLYNNSFALLKMCFYYIVTREKEYEKYIKEFTLAICSAPAWVSQGKRNGWKSDLLTGDLGFNLSLSFYLTKNLFTSEEQSLIKKSIMQKGFEPLYDEWVNPDTRIHCLDTMGHNWWSVCVCGLGGIVVTMDEDTPNKYKYLSEIVDCIKQWLTYKGDRHLNKHANFGPEGDYIEYVGYMMYGLANFVSFEELYRRTTGDKSLFEISPLGRTVDYIISCIHKIDGKMKFPKFGDTKDENGCRHSFLYLANYYNRGELIDLYENIEFESCSAYDLIFFDNLTVEKKQLKFKPMTVYPHTGYAFVHGRDNFLFAIKTGETGCHNHRDNGTFTISHKNKELIIDSGTCPYGMEEYLTYFCAPEAHNVITFNGEGIREDGMYCGGVATMGEIASYINEPDYKYILADCTKPYLNILQKNMRHVILLEGVVFIIDDIYADRDGYAEFLLHYAGNAAAENNEINIKNDEAEVNVLSILPKKGEITVKEGLIFKKELQKTKYFSIKGHTKNKSIKFITAFVLDKNIKINQIAKDDILELFINRGKIKQRLIFNFLSEKKDVFNNPHITYDNIKTNAFITYLKEKDGYLSESALVNGFYLYHNNKRIFLSMKNQDVYIK